VDFGTKPGDKKKHSKQKHFHPEGEATSCPVKTSARPIFRWAADSWNLYYKGIGGGGCTVLYFFLSLHKKRKEVGAKDLIIVCVFLSRSQQKGGKRIGLFRGAVHECTPLSPFVFLPLPEVSHIVMFNLWGVVVALCFYFAPRI
jgi:hypothetical protein